MIPFQCVCDQLGQRQSFKPELFLLISFLHIILNSISDVSIYYLCLIEDGQPSTMAHDWNEAVILYFEAASVVP